MAMTQEVSIWYEDIGKEWIGRFIPTLDKMIQEEVLIKGVYAILVDNIYAYIGEAGDKSAKRTITDRLCEHAYHIASNPKCYFGITHKEIVNHNVEISVKCLKEEKNSDKRKEYEKEFIKEFSPYTQCSEFQKFSRKNYNEKDLCILKKYRRDAFLQAKQNNG